MDITLALGGGGVKGIAHIGVIDCLVKAGFRIRAIAGSSAGGLVGSIFAAGYNPGEILTLIDNLNPNNFYARRSSDGPSLIGYNGLAKTLVEVLGESHFSDLKIPFACTAVDTLTSQEIYLNEGRVLDAVLATIAFPGIFPPKIRGLAELVDGAILDPVPVSLARRMSPRLPVVAVVLNPSQAEWASIPEFNSLPSVPLPIPTPIIEGFARMRLGQALRIFLQSMDISARMLTELRLEADKPEVVIRPNVFQYGMLDMVNPRDLIQEGYQAAEKAIPEIHKALSWSDWFWRNIRQFNQSKTKITGSSASDQSPAPPSESSR